MKKFLKIIGVVILILVAIGATVWGFYAKLSKQSNAYKAALKFKSSSEKVEILANLNEANALSGVNRFAFPTQTILELEKINKMLTPYLSIKDEDIDGKRICHYLNKVTIMHSSIMEMLDEYNVKASNVKTFNKVSGANPVYEKISTYIVRYSKYLSVANEEIDGVINIENDLKFQEIEIYLNITINTFENLHTMSDVLIPKSTSNLEKAHQIFDFNNLYISKLSSLTTLFVKNYLKCEKAEFAKTFASKYDSVITLNGDANNDAMYYLKQVVEG